MAPKRIKVKPGKSQSKVGFIIGVIFVAIGCVIVIPTFGLFGIFWTAIAVFITYSNYKNAFTDDGIATHEIIIDDDGNVNSAYIEGYGNTDDTMDIEAKLKKLESLYNQGLITREEFEKKRKEIIDRF